MPSGFRYAPTLWGWSALTGARRPPQERLRRALTWSVGLACAAGVVLAAYLPGGRRAFQAGPLAPAHALLRNECGACHTGAFQTVRRLFPGGGRARSAPDDACRHCHDPGPHQADGASPGCAECHREHRGARTLARVADGHCLGCHARPEGACGAVTGFPEGHPPFATRPDPGRMRFNHAAHLRLEGVLKADGTRQRLGCSACHRPDEAGRFMKPIRYGEHCSSCHPLSVRLAGDGEDAGVRAALERFAGAPAPHAAPDLVRAALRERLLGLLRGDPLEATPGVDSPRSLGARDLSLASTVWRRASQAPAAAEKDRFVEGQLEHLEAGLFDHAGGCRFCHEEKGTSRTPGRLPEYEPTSLPARWQPHARFRHSAHRALRCAVCHPAGGSQRTGDVLMPTLDACVRCHNPRAGARHDCSECHSYHRGHP
jgi:hypothetical protein